MKHIRVASAQYDIGFFHHWSDYQSKLEGWVSHAVAGGAQLLVFPEYGSMELASVFGPDVYRDMTQQFIHLQTLWADVQALHLSLAREHGIMLLGASFPAATGRWFLPQPRRVIRSGRRAGLSGQTHHDAL